MHGGFVPELHDAPGLSPTVLERVWAQHYFVIGMWLRQCGRLIRAAQQEAAAGGSIPAGPLRFLTVCKSAI